jgi:protein O-GlcNAc transferase
MTKRGGFRPQARKPETPKLQAKFDQGLALHQQGKFAEAERIYVEIIRLQPEHFDATHMLGVIAVQDGRTLRGVELISRAIGLNPNVAAAHGNLGKALWDLKRHSEALESCDRAIALKPDYAAAYSNRGNALLNLARLTEALASYEKAIALRPDYVEAHRNRGSVLYKLKRYEQAIASFEKALALKPDSPGTEGDRLISKMRICDWSNFDAEHTHLITSVGNGTANTSPFAFLAVSSNSADQLRCAKSWVSHKHPPSKKPLWQRERYDHQRIRVAYLSPDFREHPLSFLMAGMFECHDKSLFDVTAISLRAEPHSEMRRRLRAAFEHFVDAETLSDDQIAKMIRELEIDILVDLAGFTEEARTGILAKRPSPIQVNYLGYPGTMGAEYVDYILADQFVAPNSQYRFYSEKIVLLPDSYYPTSYRINDGRRDVPDRAFTRAELGLPPTGFVFCCFNNNFKITPSVFSCWMRILKQVDDSVLWLLEDNPKAASNLRQEAVARGVNAERLIFAKRLPVSDHLARHRSADLFLDTLPYNAHTTASDALWAGLPVLTCLGETFAGRVAASLLHAVCLPELITTTLEDYEQLAVALAMDPAKLSIVKRRLAENRLTTPLFDTKRFTKHIEEAYTAMHERYWAGLAPDHIVIPS